MIKESGPDDLKQWVLDQVPAPWTASIEDHLRMELQRLGLERIRLRQIEPHPVWWISGRAECAHFDCGQGLKRALKKMFKLRDLTVKATDIDAVIQGGYVQIVFCITEGA